MLEEAILNKYALWYNQLISSALNREKPSVYCEKHHIVPASLGGSNKKDNRVWLTAREHFIAHAMLARCFTGQSKSKMEMAQYYMIVGKKSGFKNFRYTPKTSIIVANARSKRGLAISAALKGRKNTWAKSPSLAQSQAIAEANASRVWKESSRLKVADAARSRVGEKRSEAALVNMRAGAQRRYSQKHIVINNGISNKQILETSLSLYEGWERGRIKRTT